MRIVDTASGRELLHTPLTRDTAPITVGRTNGTCQVHIGADDEPGLSNHALTLTPHVLPHRGDGPANGLRVAAPTTGWWIVENVNRFPMAIRIEAPGLTIELHRGAPALVLPGDCDLVIELPSRAVRLRISFGDLEKPPASAAPPERTATDLIEPLTRDQRDAVVAVFPQLDRDPPVRPTWCRSSKQAARRLGITEDALRRRLQHVRARLPERFRDVGVVDLALGQRLHDSPYLLQDRNRVVR